MRKAKQHLDEEESGKLFIYGSPANPIFEAGRRARRLSTTS